MNQADRGVNLGGWLVLEKWITPSLFADTSASDEYSLCVELGSELATKRLEDHRASFITEADISKLANMSIKLIRLPVGYWSMVAAPPYISGASKYVDRLFEWAEKYGLKVILDLHAAPGSQNGWDHSGCSGEIGWPTSDNINLTLGVIENLARRYGNHPALAGIEPLNEPHWEVDINALVDYYSSARAIIHEHCDRRVACIISDSFRPIEMSKLLRKRCLDDVVMDVHLYQLFTPEDRQPDLAGHLNKVNKDWRKLITKLSRHHQVIVGEWSAAMSELYMDMGQENQRHYGASDYRSYARAQQRLFKDMNVSWTYWTAKLERPSVWSLIDSPDLLN